ncbi:uncharacterized protein N7483_009660 [Penicillium malachiteum]|uniref:uncharacterized protein n=1 Tax=Penicillium malachiteum TaxID=1324776 RepID=UPI002547E148|nr:uncharacterized protein N7483_009660 [Penicillium malachiteum]KAJ5721726.1 hypothetical protein N7483_009660 [Penicillium malachiteum]
MATSERIERQHLLPGFSPCTKTLPRGSIQKEGHLPLPCDILLEQDVEILMRDGARLYADVYRPPKAQPGSIPTVFAFTPFGKQGGPNRHNFDRREWRCGVPRKVVSSLEVFERPDPAYWCFHGYAIVAVDMRGTWNSDGNAVLPCAEQGQDGYDVVEWIASRDWSNGRVTMSGNSFLAATQWFVGAEQPPHLTCLAPWEGFNDVYNDQVCRGRIPDAGFASGLFLGDLSGKNKVEDVLTTTEENPLCNAYWASRQPKWENIKVPLYVVASWTNPLHTRGKLKAFEKSSSEYKWLRVHNSHEWPDLYQQQNVEDLRSFYDFFMKDVNNDWIYTLRVRLSVLNAGGHDIVNRSEVGYPLARQEADSMSLQESSKIQIFVQAEGSNGMDIFATLKKYNSEGELQKSPMIDVGWLADDPEKERKLLVSMNKQNKDFCASYFSPGPSGCLRVSHQALDLGKNTEFQPVYTHAKEELLGHGEVVAADIEVWPYGWRFEAGEILRLSLS